MNKTEINNSKNALTTIITFVAAAIITFGALSAITGCTFEKTVTTTNTMTTTTSDGNTVIKTVETINDDMHEKTEFNNIPLAIENDMGEGITAMYIRMSDEDTWSNNLLPDGMVIEDGQTANGVKMSYTSDRNHIDIVVYDEEGNDEEYDEIKLPVDDGDPLTLTIKYDEERNASFAYVS